MFVTGPGLFPASIALYSSTGVDEDPAFLQIFDNPPPPPSQSESPPLPGLISQSEQSDAGESEQPDSPLPPSAGKDREHRHHHHRSTHSAPGSLSPQVDDPVTAQMQAAEDIWNGASDFKSATSLYKDGIQDLWADVKRSTETYLQQSRFSPVSGDAFRKGGLDGVRNTAEWTERNSEIIRGIIETVNDAVSDQLRLTERLTHLSFESLEVCRSCNIPIHSPKMRALDIALLRAKALTMAPPPHSNRN
jgi:hypothetical protein